MVAAMPASLILFPLGEPLAVVLFGDVWRPAGQALMAMCLFAAGNSLLSICLEGAKAYGRPAVLARVHLFMMRGHRRGDGGPAAAGAERRRRRPLGGRRGRRRLRGALVLARGLAAA